MAWIIHSDFNHWQQYMDVLEVIPQSRKAVKKYRFIRIFTNNLDSSLSIEDSDID